jgi:uncharacterized protein (TIRG00374 family)
LIRARRDGDGVKRANVVATAAGLAAALAVFAVMFWLVDARAVYAAVTRADLGLLGVVAATILLWNLSWGLALYNVLRAQGLPVSVPLAAVVNAAGAFANHVTPLGQAGGEPVTAYLLARNTDTDYEVSLASIASLDAINVVPSLAFATAGALYFLLARTGVDLGVLPLAVLAVAVSLPVLVAVAWRRRERVVAGLTRLVRRVAGALPRVSPAAADGVGERVAGFAAAVERVATDRRRLAAALGFSALGWALQSVGLWVTFLALASSIPPYVPFFVLPLGKVGGVVPTPGGLGGAEAINVTLLVALTDAGAATIAAAVTLHSVGGYLLTTGVGAAATGVLGARG